METEIMVHPNYELVKSAGVNNILDSIRPQWKSKRLIERVVLLIKTDPSSACQRILNAAIQDLREKIIIAGIDIAKEAALANKLPPVSKSEDIESYSTKNIIDLSHYIGLLNRPDWRRLTRCYEIRRDLEHEDDEYEAGVEDCVYIFKTTVDVVLAKDPIRILSVKDIVKLIESPIPVILSSEYLTDYKHAPKQRQVDIIKTLIGKFLDEKSPEIMKENVIICLKNLRKITLDSAKVELGALYQQDNGKKQLTENIVYVMHHAGIFYYFTSALKDDFYNQLLKLFTTTGYHWSKSKLHSELLQKLIDAGELEYMSSHVLDNFIIWLFKCYIGEKGGYGFGVNRKVFFSNSGATICDEIIKNNKEKIKQRFCNNGDLDKEIKKILDTKDIKRRYDSLMDIINV
jgi:hypothetical protein